MVVGLRMEKIEEIKVELVPDFVEERTLTDEEWELIRSRPMLTEEEWKSRDSTRLQLTKIARKKPVRKSETERLLRVFAEWKK